MGFVELNRQPKDQRVMAIFNQEIIGEKRTG